MAGNCTWLCCGACNLMQCISFINPSVDVMPSDILIMLNFARFEVDTIYGLIQLTK